MNKVLLQLITVSCVALSSVPQNVFAQQCEELIGWKSTRACESMEQCINACKVQNSKKPDVEVFCRTTCVKFNKICCPQPTIRR